MPSVRTEVRNIAVVTGTRAEYGLLVPVLRAIADHARLDLQLVLTGTHLTTGSRADIAFPVAAKVTMQKRGRAGRSHDAAALGRGLSGLAEAFAALEPDVVVVLGDRIEAFAAASAASVSGVRVAHLHGGDRAEGVADEAMRHAITKLAHLHLPATATSRRRIVRMGEAPGAVVNVGSPAVDGLQHIEPATEHDGQPPPRCLVMQHSVGDDDETESRRMKHTLAATARFRRLVFAPNHDPGRDGIAQAIADAEVDPVEHLPRQRFVALLKAADVIVGNSSAGLIEAAVCKTPCVNVGPRQNGREKPNSVVDAPHNKRGIVGAINRALQPDPRKFRHPYGKGGTGPRVAELLASRWVTDTPVRKQNTY